MSWREQFTFQLDGDKVHFVLDQHAYLDLYSSLKWQSAGKYNSTLGHFILIQSPPVFPLTP